jgi:hypothetical protein
MRCLLPLLLLGATTAIAAERIGDIEFFGYKGLDIARLRATLPVKPGDEFSEQTENLIRRGVRAATGTDLTDVSQVCCDEKGNWLLFIGLSGASYRRFVYNSEPLGGDHLPQEIVDLSERLADAFGAALRKGGEAAAEDHSQGYALTKDPETRSLQMALRRLALTYESDLFRVLEFSSEVDHRRIAGQALGYARQSAKQRAALVRAARDPDATVRNVVTRALGVLVRSNAKLASEIPPDTFIEMLNSGIWTDRNKGILLLEGLTAARDPALLAKIRSVSLDSLIEMASWRRSGHSGSARLVLGRVAGLPEDQLAKLVWEGPADVIIKAARP